MKDLEFLTVKAFAEKVKVGRKLVYEWIDIGRIKALRISNNERSHWRIPVTELRRLHAQAYEDNYGD